MYLNRAMNRSSSGSRIVDCNCLTLLYSIDKMKVKTYACNHNGGKYIIGLFL